MVDLTIGEMARIAGVRTSTLRYYEEVGVLPAARRVNGRRVYGADLADLVQVARFAQSVGFSLAQIKALFKGTRGPKDLRGHWRTMAQAKLAELEIVWKSKKAALFGDTEALEKAEREYVVDRKRTEERAESEINRIRQGK